jgi:hypothetical protein
VLSFNFSFGPSSLLSLKKIKQAAEILRPGSTGFIQLTVLMCSLQHILQIKIGQDPIEEQNLSSPKKQV